MKLKKKKMARRNLMCM